jgi:hypothetical protein
MHFRLRTPSTWLRRARCVAAAGGILALSSLSAPVPASAAIGTPLADAPGSQSITFRQANPGAPSDSGRTYARVYYPRYRTGALHLHGGAFTPINGTSSSATIGLRLGINVGTPLLLGVRTGWIYHSKSLYDTNTATGRDISLDPKVVRATGTAHLVPAMLFLQVTLTEKFFLVPYMGLGAGYEWLVLRARDHVTEFDTTVTYANPAWEAYAGMGLKISEGLRFDTEVFYNGGSLGRDVIDGNGLTRREVVDVDGVGARIGLHITF